MFVLASGKMVYKIQDITKLDLFIRFKLLLKDRVSYLQLSKNVKLRQDLVVRSYQLYPWY